MKKITHCLVEITNLFQVELVPLCSDSGRHKHIICYGTCSQMNELCERLMLYRELFAAMKLTDVQKIRDAKC